MSQQEQSLEFFKGHATEWQIKAEQEVYSIIQDRHRAVLEVMKDYPSGSALLDIGCGTGQLAIEAANMGWKATGIDFADKMIAQAEENNKIAGTDATFRCQSVFDFEPLDPVFDVISAQGFIEYISLEQLDRLLEMAREGLRPEGAVAIGSRNRLFNLASMNRFTELERSLGTIDALLNEIVSLQEAASQADAVNRLRRLDVAYEQPTHHPETGIKVETRYQFTPADLLRRIECHGLRVMAIYPIHYHAMPVAAMEDAEIANMHRRLARYVSENHISRPNFLPFASSFVMKAVRG